MKYGDTKYYHVKQIKCGGHVVGILTLTGRVYGFIVQLHYFDVPGYKVNRVFNSMAAAERFYNEVLKAEGGAI